MGPKYMGLTEYIWSCSTVPENAFTDHTESAV